MTELRRPQRKTRPRTQPTAPWHLPPIGKQSGGDDADVFAVQALAKGIANEGQQRRAWNLIVRVLCETDRQSFWPGGEDGRRATDFAEGKRWVGLQLRRIQGLRDETWKAMGLPPSQENPETT